MTKPSVRKSKTFGPLLLAAVLAVAAAPAAVGSGGATNLPGGTALTVAVDTPLDGETFIIPAGETSIDVSLGGTATIGEGTPVADTSIIFVLDESASTFDDAGPASACGDPNNDGVGNTILDCEIEGVVAAAQAGAAEGTVDEFALVRFFGSAFAADMQAMAGMQHFTDNAADVATATAAAFSGGNTNFEAAVQEACAVAGLASNPNVMVLFLSDGFATVGGAIDDDLPCGAAATFETFAVGGGSACGDVSSVFSLARIADETGGTCTEVTDPGDLADVVPAAIGSMFDSLTLDSDTLGLVDLVPHIVSGDFLAPGPNAVDFLLEAPGLMAGAHFAGATVEGTDGGGSGAVSDVHEFTVLQGVFVDVKPGSCPNPLQTNSNGKLPVALVGDAAVDVADIVTASIRLEGVSPLKVQVDDVATPYTGGIGDPASENDCHALGADGTDDISLKFDRQEVVAALEAAHGPLMDDQVVVVSLTGDLASGGSFIGYDVIRINMPGNA